MEKMKKRGVKARLVVILCCVIFLIGHFGIQTTSVNRPKDTDFELLLKPQVPLASELLEKDDLHILFDAINDYRVENGQPELLWSDELAECAEVRAQEASKSWSHTRPNGTEWYTVNPKIMYGENLAKGYSAKTAIIGWQESPKHNENLLYPDFKYIGLAKYGNYIACEFCY